MARMPVLRMFAHDFIAFFRRMDWETDHGRKPIAQREFQRRVARDGGLR